MVTGSSESKVSWFTVEVQLNHSKETSYTTDGHRSHDLYTRLQRYFWYSRLFLSVTPQNVGYIKKRKSLALIRLRWSGEVLAQTKNVNIPQFNFINSAIEPVDKINR